MTTTISITGLTRRYRDQLALDEVTLDFQGPSVTGLLGRNGAGKRHPDAHRRGSGVPFEGHRPGVRRQPDRK